ncbi:MAG: glycosyltransferase [Candidatus Kapaibacteriales bacterium]
MLFSPILSIIIVNYNSLDYLIQSIASIYSSVVNFDYEIIVIDNNSNDGSLKFLKEHFRNVILIQLNENLGFGRANNFAFTIAKGKYFLLLNPDTIVEEKTLQTIYDYMVLNPNVGICGCKILNPDGTLQLACRRGFPTPWVAFTKLFGLQSLFPKSQLFGKYNQTFRNPNESYFVDAISGSFMFVRKEVVEQINGFDEDFFMYGEDLDFCYRASLVGWKIAYLHTTSIIHYKGRSTKRSRIDEVTKFYEAMDVFARKHFGKSALFFLLLKLGIFSRKLLAKIFSNSRNSKHSVFKVCFLVQKGESLQVLDKIFKEFPRLQIISIVVWLGDEMVSNGYNFNIVQNVSDIFVYLKLLNFDLVFVLDKVFEYSEVLKRIENDTTMVKEIRFAYYLPEFIIGSYAKKDLP